MIWRTLRTVAKKPRSVCASVDSARAKMGLQKPRTGHQGTSCCCPETAGFSNGKAAAHMGGEEENVALRVNQEGQTTDKDPWNSVFLDRRGQLSRLDPRTEDCGAVRYRVRLFLNWSLGVLVSPITSCPGFPPLGLIATPPDWFPQRAFATSQQE